MVDDEPDLLLLLRVNLEGEGHETLLAADGGMALQRLGEHKPDVVLLDMMMPVVDGWAVLEALRSAGDCTPVLVVSAKAQPSDVVRALELGALDYLVKPFDLDHLLDRVAEVVAQTPDQREAARRAVLRSHRAPSGQ